jgi:ethanolamine utilization protein EutQ
MSQTLHFKRADLAFEPYSGPPGQSQIARLVGSPESETMGAGIAVFEDSSVEWTVKYDELICVLSGHFRLVVGSERFECEPGDVLWIPNGTPLRYESDGRAEVFYSLYPVDWNREG